MLKFVAFESPLIGLTISEFHKYFTVIIFATPPLAALGTEVVRHGRHDTFQLVGVAIPQRLFAD